MSKNLFEYMRMPLSELEARYRDRREAQYKSGRPVSGVRWRMKIHGLILGGLKLEGLFLKQKLHIVGDKRTMTDRPVIYACTHVGRYDIEMAFRAARKHCYLFMGNPGEVYRSFDGILLFINGIIFVDTAYKRDRYIGKETCIKLLAQGGSLLIYPEGAWNTTANKVVMPLFTGTAEMAIRTGTEIVPIAIEQRGKGYYANIGENINPSGYNLAQKQQLTNELRDALCTLKWEILERFAIEKRAKLSPDAAGQFLDGIMSQTANGYDLAEIESTRFCNKYITAPEEAFAHLQCLMPRRENAFLFGKRRGWI